MKKSMLFLFATTSAFLLSSQSLFAQDARIQEFQRQLGHIYVKYKDSPDEACNQLEAALQTPEASRIDAKVAKRAYYFLANCNYQRKNLDKALQYYLKVADISPLDHQPLIDAGNVYVEQGRPVEAEQQYRAALERVKGNKPAEAKTRALIARLPGKWQNNFTFSTGIGYDSNVNSGPEDSIHVLYGGYNYTVNADDTPSEDFYSSNDLSAALSKTLNSREALLLNLGANNTAYFSENNFNSSFFSTSAGYRKLFSRHSVTIGPFVNYQTLDQESYQISRGLSLSGAFRASDKINLWPKFSVFAQDFFNDKNRDDRGFSLGTSTSYALTPKASLINSLFYTYSDAVNNQFTYNNIFLGTSLQRTILEGLTAALGYNLSLFYYADADPAYGTSRRDNGHTFFLSCDYSLKKVLKTENATLNLSVSQNVNNSNHSFQDNNRLFSALKLTFRF